MTTATATALHTAVIPAKRHSSRCPDKNWRDFADGMNLTDLALASVPRDLFGGIIVSTDRPDYQPARSCQVHVRDAAYATVDSDVQDLLSVLIDEYNLGDSYVWLLNPTSPFRDADDFERIADLIERTGCPSVVSVTPVSPFWWKGDQPMFPTAGRRMNTQDSPEPCFVENGMFYVFRGDLFREHGTWYLPGVQRYVQAGLAKTIDIDTPADFDEAATIWATLRHGAASGAGLVGQDETLEIRRLIKPPLAANLTLLANHIRRYVQAAEALELSKDHRVLDASCGQGYGSFLLAQQAGEAVGLDVNQEYLTIATREFAVDNLCFATYDYFFSGQPALADKIVCIETYEHLSGRAQRPFVDRLLSGLRPGGDLFITTPLGNDGPSAVNPHHLHEPSLASLKAVFSPRFAKADYRVAPRVDSYGQSCDFCCAVLTGYEGGSTE
jgi:CMP-N-acetylneuraminic acid synthetase